MSFPGRAREGGLKVIRFSAKTPPDITLGGDTNKDSAKNYTVFTQESSLRVIICLC